MTLREFPRSRCGKSAGSIAFSNQFAKNQNSRKWATRFLTHKSDASGVAEYRGKLTQAIDEFGVSRDSQLPASLFRKFNGYPMNPVEITFLHPLPTAPDEQK